MTLKDKTIKEIILDSGVISEEKLNQASETASQMDRSLHRVLLEKNLISEKDLSQLIANYYGVNYVALSDVKISKDALSTVPEDLARSSNVIPYKKEDGTLHLAMTDPKDLSAIDIIRKETGLDVEPAYTDKESLSDALNQYRKDIKEEFAQIIKETTANRNSDVQAVLDAVHQFAADNNGNLPTDNSGNAIATCGVGTTTASNLSTALAPTYVSSIPTDPQDSSDYTVCQDANGRITVAAPNAELSTISITR